jgi:hypothetical protein
MNGPAAAVARPWFPSPRHNTRTQTLASTPTPAGAQAQRTSASSGADRRAMSRTLCAQITAVKEQVGRPDQQE